MGWVATSLAYARTFADPVVWFDSPDDVVASPLLSAPEKLEMLRRWQRQTRARARDAGLDERCVLLSARIARSIRRLREPGAGGANVRGA